MSATATAPAASATPKPAAKPPAQPAPTPNDGRPDFAIHPIALMFPRPNAGDRESIKDSVRRLGFRSPVTAWNGPDNVPYIIDGATRIEIRDEFKRDGITTAENGATLEPEVRWFIGSESEAFDHALALFTRRDSTPSQKAAVAIKAGSMKRRLDAKDRGEDVATLKVEKSGELAERVAKLFNVSKSYIYDVATINEKRPDLTDKVAAGDLTIPQAKLVVKRWEAGKSDFEPIEGDPAPAEVKIAPKVTEVYDGLERPVHSDYAETFAARKDAAKLITAISKLQKDVQLLCDGPGGRCMVYQAVKTDLNNVKKHLKAHRPFIICPVCAGSGEKFGGTPGEKCPICGGRRYLDELQYAELPEATRNELEGKATADNAADAAAAAANGTAPATTTTNAGDATATREFAPGEWDAAPAVEPAPATMTAAPATASELSDADAMAGLAELPPAAPGATDPAAIPAAIPADDVAPPEEADPFAL